MGNRYSQYYEAWRQREAAIKAQLRQEKIARDKAIEEHRVEVERQRAIEERYRYEHPVEHTFEHPIP
jgi:hypothetical protein